MEPINTEHELMITQTDALSPGAVNAYRAAREGFSTIEEGEPFDVALFLELSSDEKRGWAVSFSHLMQFITEEELTNPGRREIIASAVAQKVFHCLAHGGYRDVRGARELLNHISVQYIELSDEILATLKEFNDRVGDRVDNMPPSSINGMCFINGKYYKYDEAYRLHDINILKAAGYPDEEIDAVLPKFRVYKQVLQILRHRDSFENFAMYAGSLFSPQQLAFLGLFHKHNQRNLTVQ